MSGDLNRAFPRALVDEWARAGVRHASLAPGSRSAPLARALAEDDRIALDVFVDERSAAFFALGTARASGHPAVVLCTSGTAAANLHPAVLEAHQGRVPLIVCTADRPPELRDTGAGQAVDQIKLYGGAVRWFCEVGVPEDVAGVERYWRSVGARAAIEAYGPKAGPVHLNLAFREPLVSLPPHDGRGLPSGAGGRPEGAPWVRSRPPEPFAQADEVDRLAEAVAGTERGLITAGWGAGIDAGLVERLATAAGWPVLADPLSGLRDGAHSVSTYEACLRAPGFAAARQPDLVLQFGAPPTGRLAATWVDPSVPRILVDPDRAWPDPQRSATERMASPAAALVESVLPWLGRDRDDSKWWQQWSAAEAVARPALDAALDSWAEPFEGRVARDVVGCLPDGATLVVGSSMPVRDVEAFARPRGGVRFVANRGVNGIDGFVSTALGVARAGAGGGGGPVVALCGDLTFLHDSNGLLASTSRGLDAVFVVVDNDGGGIFSFLPQSDVPEHFETLFGTPHGIDLAALAAVHAVPTTTVTSAHEVTPSVGEAVHEGGVRVVLVRTERAANVDRHGQAWAAVARALAGDGT